MIRLAIGAKSQQLDTLNSQLVALTMGSQGDVKGLKAEVTAAQADLDKAQSAFAQQYTANAIAMAKTCLNTKGKVDVDILSKKVNKTTEVLKDLPKQLDLVQERQDSLTKASRAMSQAMAALSLAEATDTKQQQQQITLQIQSLTSDLNELQSRWSILTAKSGGAAVQPKPPGPVVSNEVLDEKIPVELPQETTSGGSRWQTINLKSSSTTREKFNSSDARAKVRLSQSPWLIFSLTPPSAIAMVMQHVACVGLRQFKRDQWTVKRQRDEHKRYS
jgi:hypothetical protein